MYFALPQGIWLVPQSQTHPAPKKQISEQVCKSEILIISFVQGNFNRVLEGREVRNILFLVIPSCSPFTVVSACLPKLTRGSKQEKGSVRSKRCMV